MQTLLFYANGAFLLSMLFQEEGVLRRESSSLLVLSTEPLSRDFSLRSEPMTPGPPVRKLPTLGLLESVPLDCKSSSLSDDTEKLNSVSLAGVALPEPEVRSVRRSRPARTRLCTARLRWRAAKFLLPSCLEVGLAFSSSILGGPFGWRTGCSPARPCPGPNVPVIGVCG